MSVTTQALLVQPLVIQMQPGETLGLDVEIEGTNVIRGIASDGVVAALNEACPGAVELGDRILEVDGKTGNAVDAIRAWAKDHQQAAGSLRLKIARGPVQMWQVNVRLQPGEILGADVDIASTNTIRHIDEGILADMNEAQPGSVQVGDQIIEVDGKPGNAVEQIRAWVADRKGTAGNLGFKVLRQVEASATDVFSRFSVVVRMRPGESLGMGMGIDTNEITEIEGAGAGADLNKAFPGSLRVGDRILAVDGLPCPLLDSTAKLESWFQERKQVPRDLRITVLRPVQPGASTSELPPCEYPSPSVSKPTPTSPSKGEPLEDVQSTGTGSTTDMSKRDSKGVPDAKGQKLDLGQTGVVKPVVLPEVIEAENVGGSGWCCAPACCNTSDQSQQITVK
jgi:hypothetical protein